MRKFTLSLVAALAVFSAFASDEAIVTLDLTKAETPMTFNSSTGAWSGTYDDDEVTIDSQLFCIIHNSMSDWQTWWGFTASNSSDNSLREDFITYQFSAMPRGGILLNEDGTIKKEANGAPAISSSVPYLVAFANPYFAAHPAEIIMSDGLDHEAVGVYVSLNSYTYYSIADGNGMARQFSQGDSFTLTVYGEDAEGNVRHIDVPLASFDNGDLTATRGWKYVDLSDLGKVNTIWFTTHSTDVGAYGENTPSYFCLDKLSVKANGSQSSVAANSIRTPRTNIFYSRKDAMVKLSGSDFAMVFDPAGHCVMTAESDQFSVAHLPAGVYIIKSGDQSLRIIR